MAQSPGGQDSSSRNGRCAGRLGREGRAAWRGPSSWRASPTCEDAGVQRAIDWVDGEIRLIDQPRLPDELVFLGVTALDQLIDAIARLAVRGAPALGVAGALGVAQLARTHTGDEAAVREGAARLRAAR